MSSAKPTSKKRGKKSWIFGTKLAFFASQKSEWEKSSKARTNKKWGRAMAVRYSICYGHLDLADDLKAEPTMPTDDEVEDWEDALTDKISTMTKEEADKCEQDLKALTQTILSWYRYTYKTSKAEDEKLFSEMVHQIHGRKDKPRRVQQAQMYTSVNWEFGLKDAIVAKHKRVVAEVDKAHKKALDTTPSAERPEPKTFLSVTRRIVQERWDSKSEDVKNNIKAMVEQKLVDDMAAYKALNEMTPSPELYQNALERGAVYLQRMADTMASTMGLTCTILLCGPMAEKGGRIEVRSVHSGVTRATGLKWNDDDPAGFREVEKCMIRFGTKAFSEAECASRALQGHLVENDGTDEDAASPREEPSNSAPPAIPPSSAPINEDVNQPPIPPVGNSNETTPDQAVKDVVRPLSPPLGNSNETTLDQAVKDIVQPPSPPMDNSNDTVPGKAVDDTIPPTRCTTPPPSESPPVPMTPPLHAKQVLNEELAALLRLLSDTDRRSCMQQLRRMSNYEFEQQKNIAVAHAALVEIVADSPLNSISIISKYLPKNRMANPWKQLLEHGLLPQDKNGGEEEKNDVQDAGEQNDKAQGEEEEEVEHGGNEEQREEDEDGTRQCMDVDDDLASDIANLHWDNADSAKWWPELHSAFDAFKRGRGWGTLWTALIDSLLVFEEKAGFVDDPKITLGTKHRPAIVAEFMKDRRNYAKTRRIDSFEEYKSTFWCWWKSLQPSTRLLGDNLTKPASVIEWEGLQDKSGRNGITLVIAVLLWWREAMGDSVDSNQLALEDWALAVTDVTWVLDNMIRNATFRRVSKTKSVSIEASGTSSAHNTRKRAQPDEEDKENAPLSKKLRRK